LKIIVCDSGPILHLAEVKSIELILNMGDIFIPHAVQMELMQYKLSLPEQFKILTLSKIEQESVNGIIQNGKIHKGEAEAIILVKRISADYLLTDDATARLYAEINKINVHGSLGIVLWNLIHKKITKEQATSLIFDLKKSSLWVSEQVFQRVIKILNETID
jgi:predicted nucleic acid-binding protein